MRVTVTVVADVNPKTGRVVRAGIKPEDGAYVLETYGKFCKETLPAALMDLALPPLPPLTSPD